MKFNGNYFLHTVCGPEGAKVISCAGSLCITHGIAFEGLKRSWRGAEAWYHERPGMLLVKL